MRRVILLIALAALSVPALAATAQQEKMKTCNAEAKAKGLKGDAYKKFRDDCLKAKPAEAAPAPAASTDTKKLTPQQEKMKSCNSLAASQGLSGDARKKFMSSCLKGS